ncbi:DMT family transporter [Methyloglobulus sp.]|uniref:DMT family transporter n=1 Tax=Methyloglobulus sp. TaxID=2518622 RepID=UPI00184C717C|nr:EamA family transporter [Methyloglobulus sp.]
MQTATPLTAEQHSQQIVIGCVFVLLAAFGFSAKSILVKLAYANSPQLDAITLMLLRMAISLPFFLVVAVWSNRPSKQISDSQRMRTQDWLMIMVLGFLGYYLSSLLDFEGLTYISAGLERLILYLYPTFVVLLTAGVYRKAINRRQAFALMLSYAGILLVYADHQMQSNSPNLLLGSAYVASSAMTFAIFMVGSGVLIKRIGAIRFTAYSMTVACVVTGLHFIIRHGGYPLQLPASVYGLASIMAIFSTVLPSFLMNAGIQRIGAGSASIISSAGPVGTLILAFFLLGEALTVAQLAGTCLVLIGVYVVSRAKF